jgi:hypothetical protein
MGYTGQIMVYRYNGIHNAKQGVDRNSYTLRNVNVNTGEEFRNEIKNSLDEVPPGQGYVLVKWNGKAFICELDPNDSTVEYVRHSIGYHPLLSKFTI